VSGPNPELENPQINPLPVHEEGIYYGEDPGGLVIENYETVYPSETDTVNPT
jgi:hypothetical protein